jgi:3-isopropylmalate/(R)-2-methylmalate dehydratase small subunit
MMDTATIGLGPIHEVTGRAVVVMGDDIDTDRIIPARYLKRVAFTGLGALLFHDERYDESGTARSHPLNEPDAAGAAILITGRNFGCGSSREHAPQALVRAGFRAVVAESFGEIFFGNALTLGLLCVTCSRAHLSELAAWRQANPGALFQVDVEAGQVRMSGAAGELAAAESAGSSAESRPASLPDAARDALLSGQWDPLDQLSAHSDAVRQVAQRLPYLTW